MKYPGRIIKKGESDKAIVKALQKKLSEKGCGPVKADGDFGKETVTAVKLFQARFTDQQGAPLVVDGEIGSISWAALFGAENILVSATAPNKFLQQALDIARSQIGVTEKPPGSNSGPEVTAYQSRTGIPTGLPWCMAFVYWCYDEASKKQNKKNPLIKTGGVLAHWNKAACKKISAEEAIQNPGLIKPGQIFMMSFGKGTGHTGLVEKVEGGILTTIEGNTNDGGSREGIGVFRRNSRKIGSINKGFLEY
jgi:hypothetical protein